MTFSALDSALTGALFATAAMRAAFSDRARIAAMLKVEAALARAEAAAGLAPKALAAAVAAVKPDDLDLAALGEQAETAGVLTIPFVKAVEARLPEAMRGHFHKGATSQDILDTALMLQVRDGLDLIALDLLAIVDGLAALAKAHRRTPSVGRTYGQHAAPITFGYEVALWLTGVAEAAADLPRIRERALVASLGGPVGTLAGFGDKAPEVIDHFAKDLGLGTTAVPWHSVRNRVAETGAWLAILIGALAKMATDVVSLASTEIGEVSEPHVSGRGGSSAMPHKRNPVSATLILAAHGAAKGHATTLIDAMATSHQRAAGGWHAEWHALPQLFGLASGALKEARLLAAGLVVDKRRMLANLDLTRGLLFADAAAAMLAPKLGRSEAHRVVEAAADEVRRTGKTLGDALAASSAIPKALQGSVVASFDLAPAIAAAAAMTDRAVIEALTVRRLLAAPARKKR
jgi:3-carboxy-cis,cis-muconate cycloisomerase